MTRSLVWSTVAFSLAIAASLTVERFWPKVRVEPFALAGAGLVMLAAAAPARERRERAPGPAGRTAPLTVPQVSQRAG